MKNLVKQIASFLLLLLLSCAAFAQSIVQVEIDSVDFGNNNISVTHNGKLRKLAVASNAEITIEGKRADLATLMPGNTASITYDKNVGAVTKIAAQRPVILPAEKLAEGWGQIDDRLIFLMVRLASTEASLEAIDNALIASNRNQARKTGQAKQADKKSENMDRMGGGPIPWATFYGRAAEKFFYHPTDRNTSYHTETILSQQAPSNDNQSSAGVPSRQGLPVHQRPPQFDYLYRANETAKARAEYEIAEMKGKLELLAERKRNLEAEQAGLWCEVAFRSVSHYDLDKKPLYRFEPILNPSSDSDARYQFKTISGAASFMALGLSIVEAAQKDQSTTFSKIKPAVAKARQDLNDSWLRIGVDVTDRKTTEGKFNALAKRLEESASNLSDSYVVALEGDMANDQQRKYMFRGLLQESLIRYAETILALDEMATLMKDDWNVKPDVDTPIKFVSLSSIEAVLPVLATQFPPTSEDSDDAKEVETKRQIPFFGRWSQSNGTAIEFLYNDEVKSFFPNGSIDAIGKWQDDGNGKGTIYWGQKNELQWNVTLKGKSLTAEISSNGVSKSKRTFLRQGILQSINMLHKGKDTWIFPIEHSNGNMFVNRADGSKVIVRTEGNRLTWPSADGINEWWFDLKTLQCSTGEPWNLIYGDK